MSKEDIKEIIGRSPDASDCFIMRMYFVIRERMSPVQSEQVARIVEQQFEKFNHNRNNFFGNSNR